jgi:diguanylate cyclase (GGDEF)-like protein
MGRQGRTPHSPAEERRRPENRRQRKRVELMTDREKIRALLTDELTGLGNRRAWEEGNRRPVQAMVDVEGLKWVNDNVGWAFGDALLKTVANAIRDQGVKGYRLGGDEFVFEGETREAVESVVAGVRRQVGEAEIEASVANGSRRRFKGATVHAGIGASLEEAHAELNRSKKAGTPRGGRPRRLKEIAVDGANASVLGLASFWKHRSSPDVRFFLRALREADPDFGEADPEGDVKRMSHEWLTRRMR